MSSSLSKLSLLRPVSRIITGPWACFLGLSANVPLSAPILQSKGHRHSFSSCRRAPIVVPRKILVGTSGKVRVLLGPLHLGAQGWDPPAQQRCDAVCTCCSWPGGLQRVCGRLVFSYGSLWSVGTIGTGILVSYQRPTANVSSPRCSTSLPAPA